ncbi:MAG: ATP-binding cassette domain-containing protein [Erysipelotrichales bacterium]|nr:MAG: ATP-binding cassette domain-containing protein [Erysipelotrichales bacterium]
MIDLEQQNELLRIEHIEKVYGRNHKEAALLAAKGIDKEEIREKTGSTIALWDINFSINQGEVFVIIGLSGSGKSTLVRFFNLLHHPTAGHIFYEGKDLMTLKKKELIEFRRKKVSMVFQHFGLMDHRNVIDNVAYGLEVVGMSKEERYTRAREVLTLVGLTGIEKQSIASCSGGMKQRIGLARALASDTEVLLMDEPFSALDPLVRKEMQFELLTIQRRLKKTIIFITHDMDEAFKLGDRLAILRDGRLIQVATPQEMISNPADDYVKTFIQSADKTKVVSVSQIMQTPTCVVLLNDGSKRALQEMKSNNVSTAYVVDKKMKLQGIVTVKAALDALESNKLVKDFMSNEISSVDINAIIVDILPIAVSSPYPLAVVDDGVLRGIVTKASVISTMI